MRESLSVRTSFVSRHFAGNPWISLKTHREIARRASRSRLPLLLM